jgi:hypothetical protein
VNPKEKSVAEAVAVIGLALLVIGLTLANLRFARSSPGGNDFLARWVAARSWVLDGLDPYDPQVSLRAQERIYGRAADPANKEDLAQFAYPLHSMLFFAPMGLIPYTEARAIWMTLLEIGLPVIAILGLNLARWKPRPWHAAALLAFSVFWYHGVRSVVVGQFAVIDAALMIGSLLAVQRRWDLLAGCLLALSTAKPQMPVLLYPFILIWAAYARRWRLVASTLVFSLALLLAFLMLEPSWPLEWIRQLAPYTEYATSGPPVWIFASYFPTMSVGIEAVLSGALLAYLLWEWIRSFGKSDDWFQWTAAMTIVVTNMVAVRTATTNYVVMLPALILILAVMQDRWGNTGAWAGGAVLIALLIGLWVLFLATIQGNHESRWMYFPLPLLTLVGLWLIRRFKARPEVTTESRRIASST